MKLLRNTLVIATLLAIPALALAARPLEPQAKTPAKSSAPAKPAVTHATSGVIKAMDATSLVITKTSGKAREEVTFALDSSTQKKGDMTVGATVDVRYRTENSHNIATAVTVHAKKK